MTKFLFNVWKIVVEVVAFIKVIVDTVKAVIEIVKNFNKTNSQICNEEYEK